MLSDLSLKADENSLMDLFWKTLNTILTLCEGQIESFIPLIILMISTLTINNYLKSLLFQIYPASIMKLLTYFM